MLKISFTNSPQFTINQNYIFHSPDGRPIYLQFKSLSRIDDQPIFELNPRSIPISTPLDQITYNNIKPISIEIITPILELSNNYHQNKELLIELLFDLYDIDESKLHSKEGLKEIVRNIKLINILNNDE